MGEEVLGQVLGAVLGGWWTTRADQMYRVRTGSEEMFESRDVYRRTPFLPFFQTYQYHPILGTPSPRYVFGIVSSYNTDVRMHIRTSPYVIHVS